MSFISKFLGLRSFEEQKTIADDRFAAGDYGGAKLAYQDARDRARGASPEQIKAVEGRIAECRDALARARIGEAAELLKRGQNDLAMAEIQNAVEIAASEEVIREAEELAEQTERGIAREGAEEPAEPTDEDRYVAIAGSWEDEQDEEYEGYGADFRGALLQLYGGKGEQALPTLERLLKEAKNPHYLLYEVGRARSLQADPSGAAEALSRFLSSIGPDEGGAARLSAHVELSRLAKSAGDFEGAVAQLQAALEAMPQDPRPYLLMGSFLRLEGHADQAVEVLEAGIAVMNKERPDWRLVQECGLAYADTGDDQNAVERLEQVVELLGSRGELDLPPETATRLAALQEKSGRPGRAADLYSLLAQGSDRENHFLYYSEAGRLLAEMGMNEEAHKMLTRAGEIAPEDEEVRQQLEARLKELSVTADPQPKEGDDR